MPKWPVLIVRTPKGWTGPKEWDGEPIEGTFRAHQVPIPVDQEHMDHADALLRWLKSYEPEKLFDAQGRILEEIREIAPTGDQRMAKILSPMVESIQDRLLCQIGKNILCNLKNQAPLKQKI